MYFRKDRFDRNNEDAGDDLFFRDFWEPQDPEVLEQWSIGLVPLTEYAHFTHMFKNPPDFFCFSRNKDQGRTIH